MNVTVVLTVVLAASVCSIGRADQLSHQQGREALLKAVQFFSHDVSAGGGCLWQYSSDLSQREGERQAKASQIWVQPPGTPSVGEAFLEAWLITREPALLKAARSAAHALANGQLVSGGWDYVIEFDPKHRPSRAYRLDVAATGRPAAAKAKNVTTLDDDTTQSALRFLMKIDAVLEFGDAKIHSAVKYALENLLKAQYPNGAWPQRYSEFPVADEFPIKPAAYPPVWPREHPKLDYRGYYTFNDNTLADLIDTFFLAGEIYRNDEYSQAARRAGDFILLAQMPEPQPAWAQQYNADMHPAWARRFEPASITGGESQGVIRILMSLYRQTADDRYLKPVPRALDYLDRSKLTDGRLARFYELKTNRPLYFTTEYVLTCKDNDLPTHYGFKISSYVDRLRSEFAQTKSAGRSTQPLWTSKRSRPGSSKSLTNQAAKLIDQMDSRGAWTEDGNLRAKGNDVRPRKIITTRTFMRNLRTLSRFVAASQTN